MTVLKNKRKESPFEVYHHWAKTEKEITRYLVQMNFSYSPDLLEKRKLSLLHGLKPEEMTEKQLSRYKSQVMRDAEIMDWYCIRRRNLILDCMDKITACIRMANAIFPYYEEELIERRLHQDKAIGYLYTLEQFIQTTAENLPIDKNKILRFGPMIDREISMVKGWRKSDNKYKSSIKSRQK